MGLERRSLHMLDMLCLGIGTRNTRAVSCISLKHWTYNQGNRPSCLRLAQCFSTFFFIVTSLKSFFSFLIPSIAMNLIRIYYLSLRIVYVYIRSVVVVFPQEPVLVPLGVIMYGLDTNQNFAFWCPCFHQSLILNLFSFEARAKIGRNCIFLCSVVRGSASYVNCFYVIYNF